MIDDRTLSRLQAKAQEIRRSILTMVYEANSGHLGGSLGASGGYRRYVRILPVGRVYICSRRRGMSAVRPLGQFVQVGHFGKKLRVPWDHIAFRQLRVHGSLGYTRATWAQTMRTLEQGNSVSLTRSHITFRSLHGTKGFGVVERKETVKVLLTPAS